MTIAACTVPITHAVVLSLQAALQTIRRSAGYFYDIKATSVVLDAADLSGVSMTEVPWIVLGHRVEAIERSFKGSRPSAVEDRWRIVLESRIDAPGTSTSRKGLALAQFEADVERALTVDPQRTDLETLTGGVCLQALYTFVGQPMRYMGIANQAMCFSEIPVDVLLQRVYGSP
jgi:hypothetical protein